MRAPLKLTAAAMAAIERHRLFPPPAKGADTTVHHPDGGATIMVDGEVLARIKQLQAPGQTYSDVIVMMADSAGVGRA